MWLAYTEVSLERFLSLLYPLLKIKRPSFFFLKV